MLFRVLRVRRADRPRWYAGAALRGSPPDAAALLDMDMPGVSGYEVGRHIRWQEAGACSSIRICPFYIGHLPPPARQRRVHLERDRDADQNDRGRSYDRQAGWRRSRMQQAEAGYELLSMEFAARQTVSSADGFFEAFEQARFGWSLRGVLCNRYAQCPRGAGRRSPHPAGPAVAHRQVTPRGASANRHITTSPGPTHRALNPSLWRMS